MSRMFASDRHNTQTLPERREKKIVPLNKRKASTFKIVVWYFFAFYRIGIKKQCRRHQWTVQTNRRRKKTHNTFLTTAKQWRLKGIWLTTKFIILRNRNAKKNHITHKYRDVEQSLEPFIVNKSSNKIVDETKKRRIIFVTYDKSCVFIS